MPRRRSAPIPINTTTANPGASVTISSPAAGDSVAEQLGELAARIRVGQACEAGCGKDARWCAVAPMLVRFGCDVDIVSLLDRAYIWFLHPVGG